MLNLATMETIVLVPLFLVSLLSLLVGIRISRSLYRRKINLPPSPPTLPVFGNLHQLGLKPHRSLRSLSKMYGPDLMLLHFGHAKTLVVSSLDSVREITKRHDIVFSNRPRTTGSKIILYDGKDVAFSRYGEYWRQARKTSVVELLSLRRVQLFQYVRDEEIDVLIDTCRKNCGASGDKSLNLSELLTSTSNNIVSRCIIGRRFEEGDGRISFGEVSKAVMKDFAAFSFGDHFPYLRWVDVLRGLIGRLKASHRALDAFFEEIVEERKARMESGDDRRSDSKEDFADILLRVQKDSGLTQEHIKAILLDMFVGGSETTATGLEWLMAELIKNPRVMKKAQEEVRRVVGKKAKVETSDINQMEYLKCVIKENLRLHPPLALLLPRETSEAVEVGGYEIPANTRVIINAWAIQRDPRVWEKPEEFFPERFENGTFEFKLGHDVELVVFGFGRRGCPGLTFGVASTEFIIANLLYWFDWELPSKNGVTLRPEDLDMSDSFGLSVCKKVPVYAVPKLYCP